MISRKRKQIRRAPVTPNSLNGFAIFEEYAQNPNCRRLLLYYSDEHDKNPVLMLGTEMIAILLDYFHHWYRLVCR